MDKLGWSTAAHRRHKAAVSARAGYKAAMGRMKAGPRLENHTLIVPGERYHEEAPAFWKAHGFRWNKQAKTWTRDTRISQGGKIYTPAAWLQATRARFYQFWPALKARPRTDCRECGEMFEPQRDGQITCPNCESARQIYRPPKGDSKMTKQHARKRLHSHITRSRFLHLEDALDIGKIRLFAGQYRKGNGASATAFHFLDLDDARVLLADLSWGKAVDFIDYKGTSNGDGPQSRVLKINSKGDKVWFEIQNGPGEIIGQGAVKPKGKPSAAVSIPLTVWEARKLAHACLAYVRAWENKRLLDTTPTAPTTPSPVPSPPSQGGAGGGWEDRGGSGADVVTEPAHQVGASVTTATDFWTLYKETGKAAGVAYPYARSIANKYGANGDGWQAAIDRLKQAIKEETNGKS